MGRKDKRVQFEDVGQVNARMRLARQQKGITLTELALKLGYTKSHLSSVENGVSRPSPDLVEKYERALGLEPGELSQASDGGEEIQQYNRGSFKVDQVQERAIDNYQVPEVRFESEVEEIILTTSYVPVNTYDTILFDAPPVELFSGRDVEVANLEKWIINDTSPLILVSGPGGIGKTTLTAEIFHRHKHQFDRVAWFSLQDSPTLEDVLVRCISSVFADKYTKLPTDMDGLMKQFIAHLRSGRYLIVFDNFETVLPEEKHEDWHIQKKYEEYGKLLKYLVVTEHQSCILLTAREKPRGFGGLAIRKATVHALPLQGFALAHIQKMLQKKHLKGSNEDWFYLTEMYSGNPLALKLVAEFINDLFNGDISTFLHKDERISIFNDLYELLDQLFEQLSDAEREIMYWMAISTESVSLDDLQNAVVSSLSKKELPEIFDTLIRRSLIQSVDETRFELQSVIREYVTNRLINEAYEEILSEELDVLVSHSLMQAQAKEYIRERQEQCILIPLVKRLQVTLSQQGYATKLKNILNALRETPLQRNTYAAGNILNLLITLGETISEYDFSRLHIAQAFLQGVLLSNVNFAFASFQKSVFTDAFGGVLSINLNKNGNLLAVGTINCEVRVWQVPECVLLVACQGHSDWIRTVVFSPDGNTIVSGSEDTTIRLWDVHTGQCLRTMRAHTKRVYSIAFNNDGTLLASGSEDKNILVWDTNTWQYREFKGHTQSVRTVTFSPDGTLLASGSSDETIRLWNLQTGQCVRVFKGTVHGVRAIAFNPEGTHLVSGGNDAVIRLWDLRAERGPEVVGNHYDRIYTVAFSRDGHYIASGGEDRTVRLWRIGAAGNSQMLHGHFDRVQSIVFSPDGEKVVSGSDDHTIRFWNLNEGRCIKSLTGYSSWIHSVIFNKKGTTLATGGEDWQIYLWNVSDEAIPLYRTLQGHRGRIRSIVFSPNDSLIASGSEDRTIRLWDAGSGRWQKTLTGHEDRVWSVDFSPLGRVIASGSEDRTIRLWNVRTGEELKRWVAHQTTVRTIAFHPSETMIASGGEDQSIHLWDVETMQRLRTLRLPLESKNIWSIAFSPDGTLLASGSEDGIIRVWNVQSGELRQEIFAHEGRVWSVAINPTSTLVVSGGEDRTVGVWKVRSGENIVRFSDHENRVRSVCFKPHTQNNTHDYVASGSHDGTVKLGLLRTDIPRETLRSDRPYERMNITGITGDINAAQKTILLSLGAIENM